jgi:hypothetical protein
VIHKLVSADWAPLVADAYSLTLGEGRSDA